MKTYVVGTHLKGLIEALLMSTHNICFRGEMRTVFTWYPLLSIAMQHVLFQLGVEPHHGVGILGFNSPEWFITYLAGIHAG